MLENVDTNYIQHKASARVIPMPQGGNIGKTVHFIQSNAERLKSHLLIIHTGTNDVVIYTSVTPDIASHV